MFLCESLLPRNIKGLSTYDVKKNLIRINQRLENDKHNIFPPFPSFSAVPLVSLTHILTLIHTEHTLAHQQTKKTKETEIISCPQQRESSSPLSRSRITEAVITQVLRVEGVAEVSITLFVFFPPNAVRGIGEWWMPPEGSRESTRDGEIAKTDGLVVLCLQRPHLHMMSLSLRRCAWCRCTGMEWGVRGLQAACHYACFHWSAFSSSLSSPKVSRQDSSISSPLSSLS